MSTCCPTCGLLRKNTFDNHDSVVRAPIVRRTRTEQQAYVQGFKAGVRLVLDANGPWNDEASA